MTAQLEFSALLAALWDSGGIDPTRARPRKPAPAPSPAPTALAGNKVEIALNRILYRQNLAFATYVLMRALADPGGPSTIAGLAVHVGASYHATKNQIRRTPWFVLTSPGRTAGANQVTGPLVAVHLTDTARTKLLQIAKLLTHELGTL